MSARRHILKCDARWFDRIADRSKTAELRKHDRDFQIDDTLLLVRLGNGWPPVFVENLSVTNPPTVIEATISHILPASVYMAGLQPGYSMFSLINVSEPRLWTEADQ